MPSSTILPLRKDGFLRIDGCVGLEGCGFKVSLYGLVENRALVSLCFVLMFIILVSWQYLE